MHLLTTNEYVNDLRPGCVALIAAFMQLRVSDEEVSLSLGCQILMPSNAAAAAAAAAVVYGALTNGVCVAAAHPNPAAPYPAGALGLGSLPLKTMFF